MLVLSVCSFRSSFHPVNHSFIENIYIAPLKWDYSEALPTPAWPNNVFLSCWRKFWENTLGSVRRAKGDHSRPKCQPRRRSPFRLYFPLVLSTFLVSNFHWHNKCRTMKSLQPLRIQFPNEKSMCIRLFTFKPRQPTRSSFPEHFILLSSLKYLQFLQSYRCSA